MPFNSAFLETAARQIEVKSVETDYDAAFALINKALKIVATQTQNVNPSDVDVYIHGSYALNTNIYFPSNLEIMVELKRTSTYDAESFPHPKYRLHNNYFIGTTFAFNPSDFYELMFSALQELTGRKCEAQDKFILVPAGNNIKHALEITPCFTFNYVERTGREPVITDPTLQVQESFGERVFPGVILYDHSASSHIVTFPRLHALNGTGKDLATRGNFLRIVRMFKTLTKIGEREMEWNPTRGYFIQCLLFNVPNRLFLSNIEQTQTLDPTTTGDIDAIFYKVLNYLLNANYDEFVCQNLVWKLFGAAREFWDPNSAKTFIKNMHELYITFPESRTNLA